MNPAQTKTLLLLLTVTAVSASPGADGSQAPRPEVLLERAIVDIPAGSFARADERRIEVTAFQIGASEVTKVLWDRVRTWGLQHGYSDLAAGSGDGQLPVGDVNWYDSIKWCNARSEMEGLAPVYHEDAERTRIYRRGRVDLTGTHVDWQADGYRLPTEAQWEYACRAGTETTYYWGESTIERSAYAWRVAASPRRTWRHPVGMLAPNAFGLYDMSGNAGEWCWDWWADYDAAASDPTGPSTGRYRVLRGGSVALNSDVGSGTRSFTYPFYRMYETGFRVVLPAGVEPAAAPREGRDEAAARKLLELMDLSTPGLERVAVAARREEWSDVLSAYRDYFVANMADAHFPPAGTSNEYSLEYLMEVRPPFRWHAQPRDFDQPLNCTATLVRKWKETRDAAYIRQWLLILQHYVLEDKAFFDSHNPTFWDYLEPGEIVEGTRNSWGWNNGFVSGYRGLNVIQQLCELAQSLEPAQVELLDPIVLADIMRAVMTDFIACTIRDDRVSIGNQMLMTARILALFGMEFPEFRDAASWSALATDRFQRATLDVVLADGGSMEQSFNYNQALMHDYLKARELFGVDGPAWLDDVEFWAHQRQRLFAALQMPPGGLPKTGTNYHWTPPPLYGDADTRTAWRARQHERITNGADPFMQLNHFPDPLVQRLTDALWGQRQPDRPPAFTSIWFPFSGYGAMRGDWSVESPYLFFMASRLASGHASENINSLAMTAYGRHLLVSSGPGDYGVMEFLPEDQRTQQDLIWFDLYPMLSFGHNTVIVDGQSQRRLAHGEATGQKPYRTVMSSRWLAGEAFDYAEGFYGDGYVNYHADFDVLDQTPIEDVTHRRQVFYLRAQEMWIVVDRLSSTAEHTFTQLWNFPPNQGEGPTDSPGFAAEQVITDTDGQMIHTDDPDGPNVWLYHFNRRPLSYTSYYGHRGVPYRGWYATGIGGRRWEAVDIDADWRGAGDQLLVTAIVPTSDNRSRVTARQRLGEARSNGLQLTLADGSQVVFRAAADAAALEAGSLTARAEALLVTVSPDGDTRGVALGCESLNHAGVPAAIETPAFEFVVRDGAVEPGASVAVPDGFHWRQLADGRLAPVYSGRLGPPE